MFRTFGELTYELQPEAHPMLRLGEVCRDLRDGTRDHYRGPPLRAGDQRFRRFRRFRRSVFYAVSSG